MEPGGGLLVVRAGLHTTVQDAGRWGYQHLGVPVSGALDVPALYRANALVGNARGDAALEVTLVGCTLRAEAALHVAVTGARFDLSVRGEAVPLDTPIALAAGDDITLGSRRAGARAYVAVRGGIDVPLVLGSRSAWPLLARRGAVQDGDRLAVGTRATAPVRVDGLPTPPFSGVLRVLPGPSGDSTEAAFAALCSGVYRISPAASRMAYPLDGPGVPLIAPARQSGGTVNGALQILPSGLPLLLLADRQTTGGYPVAAVVVTADLTHAAQLAPGDEVRFVPCTRAEALRALWEAERAWTA